MGTATNGNNNGSSNNVERLAVVENQTDTNTDNIKRLENKIDKVIDMQYKLNTDMEILKITNKNRLVDFVGKYPKLFITLSIVVFVLIGGGGIEGVMALFF